MIESAVRKIDTEPSVIAERPVDQEDNDLLTIKRVVFLYGSIPAVLAVHHTSDCWVAIVNVNSISFHQAVPVLETNGEFGLEHSFIRDTEDEDAFIRHVRDTFRRKTGTYFRLPGEAPEEADGFDPLQPIPCGACGTGIPDEALEQAALLHIQDGDASYDAILCASCSEGLPKGNRKAELEARIADLTDAMERLYANGPEAAMAEVVAFAKSPDNPFMETADETTEATPSDDDFWDTDDDNPFAPMVCEFCGTEEGTEPGSDFDSFTYVDAKDSNGAKWMKTACGCCANRIRIEMKGFDPDTTVQCCDCKKTIQRLHDTDLVCVGREGKPGDYKPMCIECRDWREEAWRQEQHILVSLSDEGKKPYRVVLNGKKFHLGAFTLSLMMLFYSFAYALDGFLGVGKAVAAWRRIKREKEAAVPH
ncbi:hypothetical protein BB934_45555 (plasmid) [Microvirga ossetica]|uniref:Uncharacterized protein n=1 Tax=Microvirga ossetica TaxID=1882682 RepID=A0A1B2EZR6_9HYPH|nr:hypothetical protein [Microvirga ossetica]ANY85489.1 hypothetical protein BB934_45555 [Microvirga ossetica]